MKKARTQTLRGTTFVNIPPCPRCGGVVTVVEAVTVEPHAPEYHTGRRVVTRSRGVLAAACAGCEFIVEVPA